MWELRGEKKTTLKNDTYTRNKNNFEKRYSKYTNGFSGIEEGDWCIGWPTIFGIKKKERKKRKVGSYDTINTRIQISITFGHV